MSLLIIRADEVRRLLPVHKCIGVMEQAMRAASAGTVDAPPRIIQPLAGNSGFFILMPGSMREPPVYGAKIVSLHPGNPAYGHAAVQGFVTLFDYRNGNPLALMDGAVITAIRTSAASALATRELSRPDASSHGIFGTGVQAGAHLDAMAADCDISETRREMVGDVNAHPSLNYEPPILSCFPAPVMYHRVQPSTRLSRK